MGKTIPDKDLNRELLREGLTEEALAAEALVSLAASSEILVQNHSSSNSSTGTIIPSVVNPAPLQLDKQIEQTKKEIQKQQQKQTLQQSSPHIASSTSFAKTNSAYCRLLPLLLSL